MARLLQKIWLSLLLAVLVLAGMEFGDAVAQTGASSGTTIDRSLSFDGTERTYRVHVPGVDAPTMRIPVLIVLHGGIGNGRQIERSSGFSELADRFGFVAVYPDGTGFVDMRYTWNANNCCGFAHRQDVDDVGFISALIDELVTSDDVDPSRVFVTGFSNGAMMTFRLACELSGKIAAAAPYAGALNTDTCAAREPVPLLIMNGDADQNVPVAGGLSPNAGVAAQNDRVDRSTAYAVQTWVQIDGCSNTPVAEDSNAGLVTTYSRCTNGSAVEQVLIHGWDHRWPNTAHGSPVDAAATIWAFVSQFSKNAATLTATS
jgi:polyhydroxybutyrate depolymerase